MQTRPALLYGPCLQKDKSDALSLKDSYFYQIVKDVLIGLDAVLPSEAVSCPLDDEIIDVAIDFRRAHARRRPAPA